MSLITSSILDKVKYQNYLLRLFKIEIPQNDMYNEENVEIRVRIQKHSQILSAGWSNNIIV